MKNGNHRNGQMHGGTQLVELTEVFDNGRRTRGIDINPHEISVVFEFVSDRNDDLRKSAVRLRNDGGVYNVTETREEVSKLRAAALGL